jgi:hypothetical protein
MSAFTAHARTEERGEEERERLVSGESEQVARISAQIGYPDRPPEFGNGRGGYPDSLSG